MRNCFVLLIIGWVHVGFCQNLEERIYTAAEGFIDHPSDTALEELLNQEAVFKAEAKTKADYLALVFLKCHKGFYLDRQARLQGAITSFEEALKNYEEAGLAGYSDFDLIESCLIPLGNLYTKTGNFTNAENTIKQYLYLAQKKDHAQQMASAYINLAQLYFSAGNFTNAVRSANKGLGLKGITKTQLKKLTQLKTAGALAQTQANRTKPASSEPEGADVFSTQTRYNLALTANDYPKALMYLKKMLQEAVDQKAGKRTLAKNYVGQAKLYVQLKQRDSAHARLQEALNLFIPQALGNSPPATDLLFSENTLIDIFDGLAQLQTNYKEALAYYDLSFYVAALLRKNWTAQETKILNQTQNRLRGEKCIALLYNAYLKSKNDSLLYKALLYAEKGKADILKERTLRNRLRHQHPKDSLLTAEHHLVGKQEQLTNALIREQLSTNAPSKINGIIKELTTLSTRLKPLGDSIEKKYPQTQGFGFSRVKLQKKLKEDRSVLVVYFSGKESNYQFVVSAKDIALHPIVQDSSFNNLITRYIHQFDDASIINGGVDRYTRLAHHVYKALQFNQVASYDRVMVIPDGLLNFIPFETLLYEPTQTGAYAQMPFVVRKHRIAYASSTWFYVFGQQSKASQNEVLGMFPVFEDTPQKLTYSVEEAKALATQMPTKLFMNAQATVGNLRAHVKDYTTLHLSTHASSGTLALPAQLQLYDDLMFVNELYALDLNTDLVVLSACETGIGTLFKGEGAMSIARAFQFAGARNLLFSLWQINDLSTAQLMQLFYEGYSKNQSAFLSNHQSKISYLNNEGISNIKKSPYYWGAFVFYGNMQTETTRNHLPYIIGALLIVILIGLAIAYYRHKHMFDRT